MELDTETPTLVDVFIDELGIVAGIPKVDRGRIREIYTFEAVVAVGRLPVVPSQAKRLFIVTYASQHYVGFLCLKTTALS